MIGDYPARFRRAPFVVRADEWKPPIKQETSGSFDGVVTIDSLMVNKCIRKSNLRSYFLRDESQMRFPAGILFYIFPEEHSFFFLPGRLSKSTWFNSVKMKNEVALPAATSRSSLQLRPSVRT